MLSEKTKIKHSLIFPTLFLITIWFVKLYEVILDTTFYEYGIFPRTEKGLIGILASPLLHGNFNHLVANSGSFFVLSVTLFYFYRPVSHKVFFFSWIFTGLLVWIGARPSYHIGASGVIYALAAFLFTSGIIRGNFRLLAISLFVTLLYGGMVWGIFPLQKGISWESHLYGLITGVILAFYFKKYGPQRPKYSWEDEEDEENNDEPNKINSETDNSDTSGKYFHNYHINIDFKENDPKN